MSEGQFERVEERFDGIDAHLIRIDDRLGGIDGHLIRIDGRLDDVETRIGRVETRLDSMTDYLATQADSSLDRYVLLDAQDWMDPAQLGALWREINRTARPQARVIFRTAGEETILPGRVPDALLARFAYDREACRQWTAKDRSSMVRRALNPSRR